MSVWSSTFSSIPNSSSEIFTEPMAYEAIAQSKEKRDATLIFRVLDSLLLPRTDHAGGPNQESLFVQRHPRATYELLKRCVKVGLPGNIDRARLLECCRYALRELNTKHPEQYPKKSLALFGRESQIHQNTTLMRLLWPETMKDASMKAPPSA